jgi:hypothetical protein
LFIGEYIIFLKEDIIPIYKEEIDDKTDVKLNY